MKVLFLNYEYPPLGGGAANASFCILREYAKMPDLSMDFVTSSFDNEYHLEKIGENVLVHKLPVGKNSKNLHFQSQKDLLIYAWKAYWFSKKLIEKNKYDLSHSFFTLPCGFVSLLLKQKFKIPFIISLRGSDVPGYSDRFSLIYAFLKPVFRLIWKEATAVIANSEGLKKLALETSPKQKIEVVYNGINTDRFRPSDFKNASDKFIITPGASRITDRKGLKYLIEAVSQLSKKYPEICLKIMGDGNARPILENLVKKLDISDKVEFLGRVPREQTAPHYQEADVFVLPSLNEGMSNAMLEALATGLPIISTDTGGAKELVRENENGFIVKMKNAGDIAEKLEKLINNEELRKKMGSNSRLLAEKMSWKKVSEKYLESYEKTVSGAKLKTKRRKNLIVKILVALGFISWLIHSVNWSEVLFYFKQMDIWWMFAFVSIYTFGIAISSFKWKILADFKGINLEFKDFFKIYLTGAFINNFFPSIIGGDAYRSYVLGKSGNGKYIEATSTVFADRITGFFGVMILILIFSLFNLSAVIKNPILLILNLIIVASFGIDFFILILRKIPVWNYIKRFVPEKIIKLIDEIRSYRQNKILAKSLLWGVIFNFIGVGVATWMLFLDLHIPISFINFMIAISVISIVSSIPISIGNIGIKEWSFITFFGIFGVNGEAAISIAIFGRFLQMIVNFFAVPFYLKEKKSLKREI